MAATATKAPLAQIDMVLEKETKGTYRFKATDEAAPVQTIYVAKGHYDSTPQRITVTLS